MPSLDSRAVAVPSRRQQAPGRSAVLDEEFQDSGIEAGEHAESGSWGSVTKTTLVKSYFKWNDEEDRAEFEPTDVVRGYAFYGEELLLQTWHDERPDNNFERMVRAANIDPIGSWYFHGHQDGHDFTVTYTFAADGTFRRFFDSPGAGTSHEILGTYELDLDEQFANVVIQETRDTDGVIDERRWVAGQRLRVAWAATDAPDRIVISQPWDELRWDEDLGERVEYTDRWGGYGVVAHRVVE